MTSKFEETRVEKVDKGREKRKEYLPIYLESLCCHLVVPAGCAYIILSLLRMHKDLR